MSERCPKEYAGTRHHDVRVVGSFGLALGVGYECHTCWSRFTRKPNGHIVLGHPDPAPYPVWDYDDD